MSASISDAVSRAVEHAKRMLFPFVLDKWLRVGFIAFLAGVGSSSGNSFGYQSPFPSRTSSGPGAAPSAPPSADFHEALSWIRDNTSLVIGLAVGALVLTFALGLVITWISSRGMLMFVESVIHDRSQVREPWGRLREPAFQLFKFRVLVGICWLLSFALAVGIGALVALPDIRAEQFGTPAILGIAAMSLMSLVTLVPISIVLGLLDDFVVPIFYVRGVTLREAWRIFRVEVLTGNGGNIVVFYLLKFALGLAFAIVAVLATCLTCCLAVLPYIGTVVLLPAHVFFRAYSLYFLEALRFRVFPQVEPAHPFGAWTTNG